jgi:lipopolysaccharide/colanic/teichoic acid biosynthesis glycosyltransferase
VSPVIPPAIDGARGRAQATWSRLRSTVRLDLARRGGPALRRAVDAVAASAGLLALAPLLVSAVVAVRLSSPGPIFYGQSRVGKDGRPLRIYKFRTMFVDADARLESLRAQNESEGDITFKIKADPRITRVGRVLRKYSIDELPQLWNVVQGSMTIFGPRPPVPSEVAKYGPRQRRRLEVTPGLTCHWQVEGRSDLSFDQQVSLDLAYIDKSTARDDVSILLKTIPAVVTGKGAY